jgi:hypothetical protein
MRGHLFFEKPEREISVTHGDCIGVERIIGLAHELDLDAGSQAGDDVLAPLKRNADDFGIERHRIADRRVPVGQILGTLRKRPLDERIDLVVRFASTLVTPSGVEGRPAVI